MRKKVVALAFPLLVLLALSAVKNQQKKKAYRVLFSMTRGFGERTVHSNSMISNKSKTDVESRYQETELRPNMAEVVDNLKIEFDKKLALPAVSVCEVPDFCNKSVSRSDNSCIGQCQRLTIDKDVRTRISQLVEPTHLQMTPHYHRLLEEMASQVKGHYDIIIATASSDNHFLESQGLIQSIHQQVFPIQTDVMLIYYNLGLNATNRAQLVKHCKCHVIDFPFSKFPEFFKIIPCFTWKPVIIKSHLKQSNVLIWADASVRFDKGPKAFQQMVAETKRRGFQFFAQLDGIYSHVASRTLPETFHFFGEEACAYIGRGEIGATVGFFSREFFVERLLLEPWVACAVNRKCMCPSPYPERNAIASMKMMKRWRKGKGQIVYGMAHRFDQSVLNLILMKAYRERYVDVVTQCDAISITREQKVYYFP